MSKRELAKSAAGKMVLDVLSNSFVNNEPESSSSSSSPPRESQSDRLKSAQEDMLEHMFAKNQFPSDVGYAELAKKVKKSVQEIIFWFNQRREKENNHNVKCYKRSISESIQDSIMDVDLEVDSEVDSEESILARDSANNSNLEAIIQKGSIERKKDVISSGAKDRGSSRNKVQLKNVEKEEPSLKSPDDCSPQMKLETLLDPFLTGDGSIMSHNDIPQILKIMSKRKDYLDKNYCIDLLSNPRNSKQIMESISKKMGLILLRVWLTTASKDDNGNVLTEVILKLLKKLPTPSFDDLKQSKIGNAVKVAGNIGTIDVKNLADAIQTKWLQHIKREKDSSAAATVKSGSSASSGATAAAGKPPSIKTTVKSSSSKAISPALPVSNAVEKKTVTAISFDIFKSNPATSLPKIKKSDKPIVRKSPDASPVIPEPSSLTLAPKSSTSTSDGADSKEDGSKFSYRRSEPADVDNKRKMEDSTDAPKKKRKSVRFKPDDSLKEIRYYVPDSSEMYTKRNDGSHNYDKEEFTLAKSLAYNTDELKESKEWTTPELYCFEKDTAYTWGELSEEKNIQNEREKKSFQSLYFKLEDIPFSPAEPDPEHVALTAVKPIPFEEFHSQNPNVKSAAAQAVYTTGINQPVIGLGQTHNFKPANTQYQPNMVTQSWPNQTQYPHFNQNPPRFVNQSNFYQVPHAQNTFYSGNSWGNSYQRPVCENYKMGICSNGSQCPNLHTR